MRTIVSILVLVLTCFSTHTFACYEGLIDPDVIKNEFRTFRSYGEYIGTFQGLITREIDQNKRLHIVDFGAGEGYFSEQLSKLKRHDVTMITYKMKRQLDENPNLQIFKDRFFEAIGDDELIKRFGQFDVVVDYWGIIAYSKDPGQALLRLKGLCASGCRILVKIRTSKNSKRSSLYNSYVIAGERERDQKNLPEWIKSLPGLIVTDHRSELEIRFDPKVEFNPPRLEMIESKSFVTVPGPFFGFVTEERLPAARIFRTIQ